MFTSHQPRGAVALLTIVTISAFTLVIITAVSVIATSLVSSVTTHRATEQVFFAAESGIHDALQRLGSATTSVTSYTLQVNDIDVALTITPSGFRRTVTAVAHSPASNITRTLTVSAQASTFAGGFSYAVLSGNGGFTIDNNATVNGADVHANGAITGGNNAVINGNLFTPIGVSVDNIRVNGDAHVQTITNSEVSGALYATTRTGTTYGALHAYDNPPSFPYPISAADIVALKNLIPAANVISGNQVIASNQTLGSAAPCNTSPFNCKIDGNVTVNKATWTVQSDIVWITGDLTMQHSNDILQLDASRGAHSTIVIVDGEISIKNGGQVIGSGDPKSFVLLISTKNDPTHVVIESANNADAAVFFAPNGIIELLNGANLNNATGYGIHLNPNSSVTYNSNLSWFQTGSSNGQALEVEPTSWREL